MKTPACLAASVLVVVLLAGCQTSNSDSWYAKWQQAEGSAPAKASLHTPLLPMASWPDGTPVVGRGGGGDHASGMYVGYSTYASPHVITRDDKPAGTFSVPSATGGGVGFDPQIDQMRQGMSFGVRGTAAPNRR